MPRTILQTPAPILDKMSGLMGAQFLSSIGLGFGTLIGKAQVLPIPTLDKNRSPSLGVFTLISSLVALNQRFRIGRCESCDSKVTNKH